MTHHGHQHRDRGEMNWDQGGEHRHRDYPDDQRRSGGRGSWVQDRGDYGGWASGEGQGEYARDGYSAQGQFSNQRVAQYGDQGYGQDYGRQGIGWQNRHDDDNQAFRRGTDWEQGPPREREFRGERQAGGWQGPYGPDPGRSGSRSIRQQEGYGGEGAIGKKVRAATGDKAPVAVKALVEAAPGGKSSPQAGVLKATAVMARDGKAAAQATRLPEAGWPVLTVAAVHRVISEAMPESRKMLASI